MYVYERSTFSYHFNVSSHMLNVYIIKVQRDKNGKYGTSQCNISKKMEGIEIRQAEIILTFPFTPNKKTSTTIEIMELGQMRSM